MIQDRRSDTRTPARASLAAVSLRLKLRCSKRSPRRISTTSCFGGCLRPSASAAASAAATCRPSRGRARRAAGAPAARGAPGRSGAAAVTDQPDGHRPVGVDRHASPSSCAASARAAPPSRRAPAAPRPAARRAASRPSPDSRAGALLSLPRPPGRPRAPSRSAGRPWSSSRRPGRFGCIVTSTSTRSSGWMKPATPTTSSTRTAIARMFGGISAASPLPAFFAASMPGSTGCSGEHARDQDAPHQLLRIGAPRPAEGDPPATR